jgi:MSHA pilin protein MshC
MMWTSSDSGHVAGNAGTRPICHQYGFTLMELIVVIVLLGILAAFAYPRLNLLGYQQAGFFQQSLAAIRYAQQQAIANGCDVTVDISSGGCFLSLAGTCPQPGAIVNPARGVNNFCSDSVPAGSPNANIVFDKIGRPGGDLNISIGTRTIAVEPETGYAREI